MDITFKNRQLKKKFDTDSDLLRSYGKQRAKVIKMRMAILRSADNLADVPTLPPERCHQLTGNLKGQFAVGLDRNCRLLFKPNHEPLPLKDDEGINLKKVTAITILDVRDYH